VVHVLPCKQGLESQGVAGGELIAQLVPEVVGSQVHVNESLP